MYDINTKNVKKGKKIYFILLLIGLVFFFVIGGIVFSNFIKLNSLDSTVKSTRIEIDSYIDSEGTTMYSPIYYYVVDGQEYSCSSNSSSSSSPGLENKDIYYDSNNPSSCMSESSKSDNYFLLLFIFIPILFIIISIINIKKINKRVKTINELNKNGKLVKNLKYRLENTNMEVNGVVIQRPVVDYVLPSGSLITLYGDPRHDGKYCDSDGLVDLLIDENNPDNYYIDFEINRLTGNLPQDYSVDSQMNSQNQFPNQNI